MTNPFTEVAKVELIKHNGAYHHQHIVTDSDVIKSLTLVHAIEKTRRTFGTPVPQPGDIVRFSYDWPNGKGSSSYARALLLEGMSAKRFSICEQPYTPWVNIHKDGTLGLDCSGGAFSGVSEDDLKNFKYVGQDIRLFCAWGHGGGQANGAIEFPAIVNVWEYKKPTEKKD